MARRRTTKRRRRSPRATSILEVLELYALTNIMTQGITGMTPLGFVSGQFDIGQKVA